MRVWKFGGSSLADAQAIRRVTRLIEQCAAPGKSVVVCSAIAGVTDRLVRITELARFGSIGQAVEDTSRIIAHHRIILGGLNLDDEELNSLAQELLSLVERADPDSASAAWEDSVLSSGERFSVRLVAATLRQRGIRAQAIDASTFLMTTGTFQNAEPLWNETCLRAQKVLLGVLENRVLPVVTGFIGATSDGQITALGRNSSDYSAAIVAHVLDAEEVCLWTDVDGVFDADPGSDKHPNWLRELSYEEALELAQNGARVLHPKMMQPLRAKNITLSIRNTFNPDHPGTRIGPVKGGGATRKSRVALVGFGTVGRSVAKLLSQDATGELHLSIICDRSIQSKKADWVPEHICWTENFDEVLSADVDVVVELVGGLQPAGGWIRRALQSGKSVVTANKQLIAECGPELMELARAHGQRIEFGASVGGGVPVLMGLGEGLAGDRLYRIAGILNGTCNYILTKMDAAGAPFAQALEEAQALGFAEADPREDLEGFDARAKLVILARVGLHCQIRNEQIPCRSISAIEDVDFVYARELDCTIRQIALVEREPAGSRLFATVQPALVPKSSLLAHVHGNQNLVLVVGEYAGETAFSGCGAGGDPTAVAVVSDLLSIVRNENAKPWPVRAKECHVSEDFRTPHYVRFIVQNRPGIVASVAAVLASHGINIDAVLQKPGYPLSQLPFVITLEPSSTVAVNRALGEIRELDFHIQPPVSMPILLS